MRASKRQSSQTVQIQVTGLQFGGRKRHAGGPRLRVMTATQGSAGIPSSFFSVSGKVSPPDARVSGYLVEKASGKRQPGHAHVSAPGTWILKFAKINPGQYDLNVSGVSRSGEAAAANLGINVLAPVTIGDLAIEDPTDGSTVPPTFSATGTVENKNDIVSGELKRTGSQIPGTPPTQTGDVTFSIQFTSVPQGAYDLVVTATGEPSAQVGVTVDPNFK